MLLSGASWWAGRTISLRHLLFQLSFIFGQYLAYICGNSFIIVFDLTGNDG